MTEFVWLADRRQRTPTVTPQQLGTSWRLPYGSYRTCPRALLLQRSSAVASASCLTRPSRASRSPRAGGLIDDTSTRRADRWGGQCAV
jgi:hypothetical protein